MSSIVGDTSTRRTLAGLAYEVRPWQWYKQSMLLLGIVFSRNILSLAAWTNVLLAIAAFCAVAGATYIVNDISDREADRNHPVKQDRPIASGQVIVPVAGVAAVALLTGGFGVAYLVNTLVFAVLVVYLLQNVLYSVILKDLVIVDVIVVAVGFVLRAVAGVVAIGVYLSPWLVVCTFLAALLLALGKRHHELIVSDDPGETRATLGEYTESALEQFLVVTLGTLLVAYSLYTFFRATDAMMLTLPFAFYAAFRYQLLTHTTDVGGDPSRLLTDRAFVVNLVLWGLVAVAVLYRVPQALLALGGVS